MTVVADPVDGAAMTALNEHVFLLHEEIRMSKGVTAIARAPTPATFRNCLLFIMVLSFGASNIIKNR